MMLRTLTTGRRELAIPQLPLEPESLPAERKKHSGDLTEFTSSTNDVSFRGKEKRPLGYGFKSPGGALAPWRVCRK